MVRVASLRQPSLAPSKVMLIALLAILIPAVGSFPTSSLVRGLSATDSSSSLADKSTARSTRKGNKGSQFVFGCNFAVDATSTDCASTSAKSNSSTSASGIALNRKRIKSKQEKTRQQHLISQGQQLLESYVGSPKDQDILSAGIQFLLDAAEDTDPTTTKHALGVATILASELKLDVASVVAGMLQHQQNCTGIIQPMFGSEVASLVQGVTEIDIALSSYRRDKEVGSTSSSVLREERERENYRKLILAIANDIRVVLIKLADATQTLRMMDDDGDNFFQKQETDDKEEQEQQQKRKKSMIAKETLDLYAPLAHRLGMYAIKTELEDTSLKYWRPKAFRQLKALVSARQAERKQYTNEVIALLQEKLQEGGINADQSSSSLSVSGRAKSFFSIHQKMQQKKLAFDDVHDLMAFRILVEDVSQCYQALGIVHATWRPVKGRFKDYIALPKSNGYQSLHTTVMGPSNKKMEVQIRTHDMHRIAEGGVAAHWMYKDNNNQGSSKGTTASDDAQRYKWLRQLVEWAQQEGDGGEEEANGSAPTNITTTVESAETEDHHYRQSSDDSSAVSEKEVFVFSPRGQLFSLMKGATVLDFAYRVHSQVGNKCVGAKVNGKMVPLKYTVNNGDTIEILQSSNQKPNQEWLNIVQTSKAKARIKSWLRRQQVGSEEESIDLGREMLEKGMGQYHQGRHRNTIDGMSEYKKRLPHLLSTFKVNNEQRLLVSLAHGQISVASVLQEVFVAPPQSRFIATSQEEDEAVEQWGSMEESSSARSSSSRTQQPDGVVVGGKRNILVSFCRNCNPLYGEDVQGVVTQGRGVKVHRLDCRYLVESDPARRVDAVWDEVARTAKRSLVVEVLCEDVPGVLAGMSKAITVAEVNIGGAILKRLSNGQGLARFELILSTVRDLERVTLQLQREPGVINVKRR